jgi:hypothetical protein
MALDFVCVGLRISWWPLILYVLVSEFLGGLLNSFSCVGLRISWWPLILYVLVSESWWPLVFHVTVFEFLGGVGLVM